MFFDPANTTLTVIDVQGKLAELMHEKDRLYANVGILIRAAKALDIPILWCQQNPAGLGTTVPQIAELLAGITPIDKFSFSCWAEDGFRERLTATQRRQVALCGIETHVCVYQTATDLLRAGFEVAVVADATSSRTADNKQIALSRMQHEGVKLTSTEMLLFELLQSAQHPHFRSLAKLVK